MFTNRKLAVIFAKTIRFLCFAENLSTNLDKKTKKRVIRKYLWKARGKPWPWPSSPLFRSKCKSFPALALDLTWLGCHFRWQFMNFSLMMNLNYICCLSLFPPFSFLTFIENFAALKGEGRGGDEFFQLPFAVVLIFIEFGIFSSKFNRNNSHTLIFVDQSINF